MSKTSLLYRVLAAALSLPAVLLAIRKTWRHSLCASLTRARRQALAQVEKGGALFNLLVYYPMLLGDKILYRGSLAFLWPAIKRRVLHKKAPLPQEWQARKALEKKCQRIHKDLFGEDLFPGKRLPRGQKEITIVIPVYNGQPFLEKLLPGLFERTTLPHRFLFIDDGSPDRSVLHFLKEQCAGRDDCLVLENERSLGFAATVNRGASLCEGDFVILHTDTEVPALWLERLMETLWRDRLTASVSPFSNAAALFGFPKMNDDENNTAFLRAFGLKAVNQALAEVDGPVDTEAPTTSGFCMAVAREAWEAVGPFNSELYGRGCGADVDWCQRAIDKGWKHRLAPRLFVPHHGATGRAEDKALARKTIKSLYPRFIGTEKIFLENDPWGLCRARAMFRLLCDQPSEHILYVTHGTGGGADAYLDRERQKKVEAGACVLVISRPCYSQRYSLQIFFQTFCLDLVETGRDILLEEPVHFSHIVVNELASWPQSGSCAESIDWVLKLKERKKASMEFIFHDFYAVCPRINLLTDAFHFCRLEATPEDCTACANRGSDVPLDVPAWRQNFEKLIKACDHVRFFSEDTKTYVEKILDLTSVPCVVAPHEVLTSFSGVFVPAEGPLCVGVVGRIVRHKGADCVLALADLLASRMPEARIVVVGELETMPRRNILVTGPYDNTKLPEILTFLKVNVCLFPSIWPETFSFVVQELMALQAPIAAFPLGAPADRLKDYPHARFIEAMTPESMLEAILALYRRQPAR